MSSPHTRRSSIVATVCVLVLSLAACELILAGLASISPRVRLALRPWDFPRYIEGRGNPELPEHDEAGFRNSRVPPHADVITIGDSNTYGHRVAPADAWPRVLERESGLSVYNMGMGGWGPPQYSRVFTRALDMEPSGIIVCIYFGNDFSDTYYSVYERSGFEDLRNPRFAERGPSFQREQNDRFYGVANELDTDLPTAPRSLVKTLSGHLRTVALIRSLRLALLQRNVYGIRTESDPARETLWNQWRKRAGRDPDRYLLVEEGQVRTVLDLSRALAVDDERFDEGLRLTALLIREMRRIASASGSDLLVAFLPTKELVFHGAPGIPIHPALKRVAAWEQGMRARLDRELIRMGLSSIDLLRPLRAAVIEGGPNPYFETDNSHISAAGHRIVAQAMDDALMSRQRVH